MNLFVVLTLLLHGIAAKPGGKFPSFYSISQIDSRLASQWPNDRYSIEPKIAAINSDV